MLTIRPLRDGVSAAAANQTEGQVRKGKTFCPRFSSAGLTLFEGGSLHTHVRAKSTLMMLHKSIGHFWPAERANATC